MIDSYQLFNKKLLEFVEDLIFICPEVNDFRVFKDTCIWAIRIKKEFAQSLFHACVYEPYAGKVMNKDESFFIQENFNEYDQYIAMYSNDLNLVQKLKNIWSDLDDINKDAIWSYLRVLSVLNKKCIDPINSPS
jgi:hypothetical protein